ncbi:MAG: quinohemoprotein ethanol dehydrogenase [Gaiellales bacterium]|jgi:mono/diheme cytochrome c family protein|nr:quinohemoprotein ethanol dehydrogenase [Gaiellales bacterium]
MRRALLLPVLVLLAGCGSDGGSSSSKGPEGQFVSLGCASCHTLKAADSHGRTGPNLDDLKPSVADAEEQITNGGGVMPSYKSKLSAAEIHALAVYVSESAGG